MCACARVVAAPLAARRGVQRMRTARDAAAWPGGWPGAAGVVGVRGLGSRLHVGQRCVSISVAVLEAGAANHESRQSARRRARRCTALSASEGESCKRTGVVRVGQHVREVEAHGLDRRGRASSRTGRRLAAPADTVEGDLRPAPLGLTQLGPSPAASVQVILDSRAIHAARRLRPRELDAARSDASRIERRAAGRE